MTIKQVGFFKLLVAVIALSALFGLLISRSTPATESFPEPVGRKNIFFLETRSPKDGVGFLMPRQVCSIESASRLNPDWVIYLFILSVDSFIEDPYWEIVISLPNIKIVIIDALEFVAGTPAEKLLRDGLPTRPEWVISHTSDALRYTLLHKYSGIYLDMDIISLKSLDTLEPNFAAQQETGTNIWTGSAAVGLSDDEVGRKMGELVINEFVEHYNGNVWDENALGSLSRSIRKICETEIAAEATQERCHGFRVYPNGTFYAIPYYMDAIFFEPDRFNEGMDLIRDSVGVHFWNYITHDKTSAKGRQTLICEIGKNYCPRTFEVDEQNCL